MNKFHFWSTQPSILSSSHFVTYVRLKQRLKAFSDVIENWGEGFAAGLGLSFIWKHGESLT